MAVTKKAIKAVEAIQLPAGIKESDLKYPEWKSTDRVVEQFEMHYTQGLGWTIATLLIRKTRRADRTNRTYATTLDGKPCRIGMGPHVLRSVAVYVKRSRFVALQPFIDLKNQGEIASNEIRDRISSRRAQGQLNRANGLTSWMW